MRTLENFPTVDKICQVSLAAGKNKTSQTGLFQHCIVFGVRKDPTAYELVFFVTVDEG